VNPLAFFHDKDEGAELRHKNVCVITKVRRPSHAQNAGNAFRFGNCGDFSF
jgi:hypothetical protein